MDLRFEAQGLLSVGPAKIAGNVYSVTDLRSFHVGANADNNASGIRSWSIWKLRLDSVRSRAHVRLKWIYTGSVNLHDKFSSTGPKLGNFFQPQLLRTAKLVNTNCFHPPGSRFYLRIVEAPRR